MVTTLNEALYEGAAFLRQSGSPSARLDAEVLLAHSLNLRRVDLYLQSGRALRAEEEESFRALLERRGRGEPVSYLLGNKEFFGLSFVVDRRVMIPRPETELLVERALDCARALGKEDLRIADIGTGSGCIAVALARHLPQAQIFATELSHETAEVAQENLYRHGVEDRVFLLQGDLCAPLPGAVDLLVSNPPYTIWESLPEGITNHEPRLALDGGIDGLEMYRRLLPSIPAYLRTGGFTLMEVGDGQVRAVSSLARQFFWAVSLRVWPDYSGEDRVVEIGPYGGNCPRF